MSDWQYPPLAEPLLPGGTEALPTAPLPPVWRRTWRPETLSTSPLVLDAPVSGVMPDLVRRPPTVLEGGRAARVLNIIIAAVPDLSAVGVEIPVRRVYLRQDQWLRLDPFPRPPAAAPAGVGLGQPDYQPRRRPFRVSQSLGYWPLPISTPAYLSSFWNAQSVDFARTRPFSVTLQPVGGQWPLMPLLVPLLGMWAPQPPTPVWMRVPVPPQTVPFTILPTILSAGLGNIRLRKPALRVATIAQRRYTCATIAKPWLTAAPMLNGLVR